VRNGIDMAKAIACGADIVGLAYPFLVAADESKEKVVATVHRMVEELKVSMFCLGVRTIAELQKVKLHRTRFHDES
jgi:isopentenyl-diphosphate delta-isomerase